MKEKLEIILDIFFAALFATAAALCAFLKSDQLTTVMCSLVSFFYLITGVAGYTVYSFKKQIRGRMPLN